METQGAELASSKVSQPARGTEKLIPKAFLPSFPIRANANGA